MAIPSLKGADKNQFQINHNQDNDSKAIMNSTKGRNKFSAKGLPSSRLDNNS